MFHQHTGAEDARDGAWALAALFVTAMLDLDLAVPIKVVLDSSPKHAAVVSAIFSNANAHRPVQVPALEDRPTSSSHLKP